MTTMKDALLVHGYTMGDVERVARIAVTRCRINVGPSWSDRYEVAWHGVCEALYSAEEPPDTHALIAAGWQAIYDEVEADMRHHGMRAETYDIGPRVVAYWSTGGRTRDPFSDKVIERLAAIQILPMLTPEQCAAVLALAVHDSVREAAEALGIEYKTMSSRLCSARDRFRHWWHEGETPVTHKDTTETCRQGHPVGEFGKVSAGGLRYCTKCRADYKRRRRAKGLAA